MIQEHFNDRTELILDFGLAKAAEYFFVASGQQLFGNPVAMALPWFHLDTVAC
eukprot:CAMPEP_0168429036 /NCGR_PEP_ID=MMETSP0228-20121227/37164_1 /TAXON_ID=133427 /ORGANISM="Protoceratium reticulatum, Strain CCCM 535 (=CCMP 1889)" /LENGTH=52 /DNA_ID=CAMNT_0008443111 /DNA_START=74 /DNA_END=232 /DNA_ORIENTATION=-